MMRTIIIGVGNPILQNDSTGLHVAKELQQHITDPNIVIDTAYTSGFNLLEMMTGYDKAILIDAIQQSGAKTGEVKRFNLSDLPVIHSSIPHDMSLPEAFQLAKTLGNTNLPQEIVVFGVVSNTMPIFDENVEQKVSHVIPSVVQMVLSEVRHDRGKETAGSIGWGVKL